MIIRPATLGDRESVMQIALMLAADLYPEMRPDKDQMRAVYAQLVNGQHFAWVAVNPKDPAGTIRGVMLALVSDNLWAQRKHAAVLLWWSERSSGLGVSLLRKFKHWLVPRRGIRVAGFSPDFDLTDRASRLIEACGFIRRGGSFLLFN